MPGFLDPSTPRVYKARVPADSRVGTTLGNYRIESIIGRGGVGVVYLAEDLRLGRRVALKVLSQDLSAESGIRDRFTRESRIAASLDDPNIVPIHEAGEAEGLLYIAMRYVEGTDLALLLAEEGALDPRRAVSIVAQVASALDAAHSRGLVHRDVKPANILVVPGQGSRPEHVYLSDFGLTKRLSSESEVTRTGQFLGTLNYAAPEQFEGRPLDARTDVYSLGCVLFECLTGTAPFRKEQDAALMYAHLQEPPPAVTTERPELPPAVDSVVAKAMAKKPEDRFQSTGELAAAARAVLQEALAPAAPARLPLQRRRLLAAGVAGLVAATIALVFILARVGGAPQHPGAPEGRPRAIPPNSAAEIDPANGRRLKLTVGLPTIIAAATPRLVIGEGAVWEIIVFSGVAHIDPPTGKLEAVIPLPSTFGTTIDSAIAFRTLYVPVGNLAGESTLARIDPATDGLLSPLRFESLGTMAGLTTGGGALWLASAEGSVGRFDATGHELSPLVHIGGHPDRIVFGAGGVWVSDRLDQRITRLDPESGKVVTTITTNNTLDDMAAGEGAVWVLDHLAGTVTPINTSTNELGAAIRVGHDPSDITTGLGAVWVTDAADSVIYRIDPDLRSVSKIPVGSPLEAIAADPAEETLWVATGRTEKTGGG